MKGKKNPICWEEKVYFVCFYIKGPEVSDAPSLFCLFIYQGS